MPERRCAVVGCATFPDASWSLCAEHLAQIEAEIAADYAAQESGEWGARQLSLDSESTTGPGVL